MYEKTFQNNPIFVNRRVSLRRNSTKSEQVLWKELRTKKCGFLFRRQFSIGNYIVDFYCHQLKLIIELDGPVHAEQKEYDMKRENWLRSRGYTIIRYRNDQVLFEREVLLQDLLRTCNLIKDSLDVSVVTSP